MNKFIATVLATAAAVSSLALAPTPANADPWNAATAAGNFLSANRVKIISNLWTPWNLQVFMTNLSPQETRAVFNQFGITAVGELRARCLNKVQRVYSLDVWNQFSANRWIFFPMRVENGQANCYMRMPRDIANGFISRRGW